MLVSVLSNEGYVIAHCFFQASFTILFLFGGTRYGGQAMASEGAGPEEAISFTADSTLPSTNTDTHTNT